MGKNQWVVPHDGKWAVRGEGNSRVTSTHRKQETAQNVARSIAKVEKSELIVQGRDGRIRDKDSFGKDPCPPKDREH
jgi:hypothetical protein